MFDEDDFVGASVDLDGGAPQPRGWCKQLKEGANASLAKHPKRPHPWKARLYPGGSSSSAQLSKEEDGGKGEG